MDTKESRDVMSAEEILTELQKLADSERSEDEEGSDEDAAHLDDAIASVEKFISAEKGEMPSAKTDEEEPTETKPAVIDTGVLTGPINGLKNFLVKKAQDNQGY